MRAALFVALLLTVPVVSATEFSVPTRSPVQPPFAEGMNALAAAMQAQMGTTCLPTSDPHGTLEALCMMARDLVQQLIDAAICASDPNNDIPECLTEIAGVVCISFVIEDMLVVPQITPPNPIRRVLTVEAPGAGQEFTFEDGVYRAPDDNFGSGNYLVQISVAAECIA